MLYNKHVPITESGLLVIDAQDTFKAEARWAQRSNKDFEKNVGRLIELYRRYNLPIVYVLHSDEDPGWERDSPNYKLMDFLSPLSSEPVLHKQTRNAFTSTGLPALLMEKGVRRVVITGIQMEQCCETSARVAADLGYTVDFVTEATVTFPIANYDNPREELSVDAIRERTEYVLRRRFATIQTVDSLAAELEQAQSARTAVEHGF
jgi:nicotinamidase-related amidase